MTREEMIRLLRGYAPPDLDRNWSPEEARRLAEEALRRALRQRQAA
ncbi:MAG TPA: hypothetical protein VKV25_00915 [Acidimicrobiales bacterium]|nr:hypothetical protein [Acidimicrobiales bacterium]